MPLHLALFPHSKSFTAKRDCLDSRSVPPAYEPTPPVLPSARRRHCCDAAGAYQRAHVTPSQAAMMSFFRAKQLGIPAARWGVAAGSIGFFLLYEDLPQLILQTPYGNFPGWTGVAVAFGMMKDPKAE